MHACMYVCINVTFSNIFSETTRPIKAKFYVEPPCDRGKELYPNGPGQVKIGPSCLCMGKKVKQWIFQKLLKSMMSTLVDAVN